MKTKHAFSWLLAVFFILSSSQAFAQEGIRLGNLKVIPGIEGQTVYDDNIFMKNGSNDVDQKKVSDWIYHVKPSLLLNYTMPERGFINLGYRGDWAFYDDNSGNNWKNNQGVFAVDYRSPGGLIIGIDNLYVRAEDPYGSPDQYNIGRVTKRWNNDLKTKVGYLFSERLRSFVYYNFYKQRYGSDLDASQDYYDNEVGIGMEMKFLPKTWGFVRYHYGERSFDSDLISSNFRGGSDWHKASAGLTWDAMAKLTGELNFGYQWKTYDNTATSAGILRQDVNTWIAATVLNYKPLETTTISLNVVRATRDSAADTGEYFNDTSVGLNLQQIFLRRFTFKVGGMYGKNDYNTNNREDDNYQANAGLEYKPKDWLGLGVEYWYREKSSNVVENEFKDNQFIVFLKLMY